MNTKDFLRLGVPLGQATRRATDFISKFILGGGDKSRLHEEVAAIVANPSAFVDDPLRGEFAKALLNAPPPPRAVPVKYRQWGEGLEHDAVMQMENAESLNSASHGAGRTMSRKSANEKFNWKDVNRFLKQQGVTLISAGLDEVPMAYKNIREVMAAQNDLVTVLGQFDPKLVKMAPSGERPED
jgi:tRNA-splicing ligase RtcB